MCRGVKKRSHALTEEAEEEEDTYAVHSHRRHRVGDTLPESSPFCPSPVPTGRNYHRRHDDENLPYNLAIFRRVFGTPSVMSDQSETIEVKPVLPMCPSPTSTPSKSEGTKIRPRSALSEKKTAPCSEFLSHCLACPSNHCSHHHVQEIPLVVGCKIRSSLNVGRARLCQNFPKK